MAERIIKVIGPDDAVTCAHCGFRAEPADAPHDKDEDGDIFKGWCAIHGEFEYQVQEDADKIGVDVWIAATIYVEAENMAEAENIVAEKYAGTRINSRGWGEVGEDLPMDDDDFMSSAMTIYGLAGASELVDKGDAAMIEAAPVMLAALIRAESQLAEEVDRRGDEDEEYESPMQPVLDDVRAAIWKARGGK